MPVKGLEERQAEASARGRAFLEKQPVAGQWNGVTWFHIDPADPSAQCGIARYAAVIEAYADGQIRAFAKESCSPAQPGAEKTAIAAAGPGYSASNLEPADLHGRLIRETQALEYSKGNAAAEARVRFEATGSIIAILSRAASEASEKAAATHIFDGERVKYGYHARQIKKLIEEIEAL